MLDPTRMLAGAGGGQWNTVVKPADSMWTYGTDGNVAGVNPGAFSQVGKGLSSVGGAMGSAPGSSAPAQGAFASTQASQQDPNAAAAQMAQAQAAAARQRAQEQMQGVQNQEFRGVLANARI